MTHDHDVYLPELLDRAAAERLRRHRSGLVYVDTIADQLDELVRTRCPTESAPRGQLDDERRNILGETALEDYGTWVWFPWSGRIVRALPRAEFRELRANRNHHKITIEEQHRLRGFTVAVVGLSVGHSAALTLAAEGVGGRFRLADFDTLSLSNLNRIRTGVHNLGLNKAVIAAREMAELDPYVTVQVFADGVTPQNLDAFLDAGDGVDLVVEECDDLYVKLRIREAARARGIPVVMETSDRGMIDVERFDLEPGRRSFHGLVGDTRAREIEGLGAEEKLPFVLRILDTDRLSSRAVSSLLELKESLQGWPQLASAVALGGALATDAARRVLLGQLSCSGRFRVDLEELISADAAEGLVELAPREPDISPEALRPNHLARPAPRANGPAGIDEALVEALVEAAARAPSVANGQPWRFVVRGREVVCRPQPQHAGVSLDHDGSAVHLALGAAVENLATAAARFGVAATVRRDMDPEAAPHRWIVELDAETPEPDVDGSLYEAIAARFTDRHCGTRQRLCGGALRRLSEAAEARGARVRWATDMAELEELAEILAECQAMCHLDAKIHGELMAELRWTREEVESTRDGLDVSTLQLSAMDGAALRLLRREEAVHLLGRVGTGRSLGSLTRKWVRGASAIGLLTVEGHDAPSYFRAGRGLQHLWLRGTSMGIGLHPITVIVYLFARLERGGGAGLTSAQRATLHASRRRFNRIFERTPGRSEAILFRVLPLEAAPVRSLRRHISGVLSYG